jgi:hypothetical protein
MPLNELRLLLMCTTSQFRQYKMPLHVLRAIFYYWDVHPAIGLHNPYHTTQVQSVACIDLGSSQPRPRVRLFSADVDRCGAELTRGVHLESIREEERESVKIRTPSCRWAEKAADTSPRPGAAGSVAHAHAYRRPPHPHADSAENSLRAWYLMTFFSVACKKYYHPSGNVNCKIPNTHPKSFSTLTRTC